MTTEGNANEWKLWAMGIHLSVFLCYLLPILGIIVPIVIWQVKKDQMPELDAHGKEVVNFMISETIYLLVAAVLCLAIVGIFLIIPLAIVGIVFPIVGGIKAHEGILWRYPMTIRFIK